VNRAGGEPVERHVPIRNELDIVMARKQVREEAWGAGLRGTAVESLATAVSELARNIVVHAGHGELVIRVVVVGGRRAIIVAACDGGPGIGDIDRAMQDGFSTQGSLGMGLPSARRLTDEFEIVSAAGAGTTVQVTTWIDREAGHGPR
jgi:serine/threonine-protein kinase RsbT